MADKRVIEQTASTELYNDDWFLKDSVVEGTTKISAAKLKELLGADGTQALEEIANAIAEEYDNTHTYAYNSWVFHEGVLYRCIGNNVTGTWNATKWQAKTIKQFIADSENLITGRLLQMFGEYMPFSTLDPPSIEAISKGDIFIYQRTNKYKFYRAKADHPQGVTEFDIDDWDEFDTVADLIEDVTENAGKVADVQVKTTGNYETVVENKIAKIDLSSVTAYGEVPNLPQAIATFTDGADAPMPSLKVAIEPQQEGSGDPSPTNVRPISGWDECKVTKTGKNLFDVDSITVTTNKLIDAEGVETANDYWGISSYYGIKPNTTYSLQARSDNAYTMYVVEYDINKNFIQRKGVGSSSSGSIMKGSFTTSAECRFIRICLPKNGSSSIAQFNTVQVELGNTPSDFEPYAGTTYTIDLDGTRYGGTLDVVNGTMTVDRVIADLGTLNWIYTPNKKLFSAVLSPIPLSEGDCRSSIYEGIPATILSNDLTQNYKMALGWIISRNSINIRNTDYTDENAFKTAMNGVMLVYELATPITYQLTPTQVKSLLGQNNVWADTGDINDCVYRRDMSSTIDDIIARLEALEG